MTSALPKLSLQAPVGSSDYQFMGENHSDNSAQSKETTTGAFTVYVGDVDQTALATGTWASDSTITIRHRAPVCHRMGRTADRPMIAPAETAINRRHASMIAANCVDQQE